MAIASVTTALTFIMSKTFGIYVAAAFAIFAVISCSVNSIQTSVSQMSPGEDSDLFFFNDAYGFFKEDLRGAWADMREANRLAQEGKCEFTSKGAINVGKEIVASFTGGLLAKSTYQKASEKYQSAIQQAQSALFDMENLLNYDLTVLDNIGVNNENYSGPAQPYFENGTEILGELALLQNCTKVTTGGVCKINATFAITMKYKEIFERKRPNLAMINPVYCNITTLRCNYQADGLAAETTEYEIFFYNSLVGRNTQGVIYDLYGLHVELDAAAKTMENENAMLKASLEDAEKRIKEKFDELKEEKIERVDGFLLNGFAKEITALRNTFELGAQEGSPSLAVDFEKLKNEFETSQGFFNDAKFIEGQKQGDYLHYSIEKLKEANLLSGKIEKLSAELYEKLAALKENSREAYENLKEKTKNAFLSETCQKAKEAGDAAHLKTAGEALADYKYALSLLNLCAASPSEFENFEENFEYLGNLIVQLEGKADVSSEKSVLKSLERQKGYLDAPQMEEKLEKLLERLRLKAGPVEKQVLQMRGEARDVLSAARDFEENLGVPFENLEKQQADFESSLNLEVFENVGTLFDKYSAMIDKLGPQVEKESENFLEKMAKMTLLFSEVPVCNQQSKATLLVKIRNPLSIPLAKDGVVLRISPEFSESAYVKVNSLRPGEEIYSEHKVMAEAGKCEIKLESLGADENSAQWLVDLDITSYTEKLYVVAGDEKIILSGDKEGWTRKEHRRVTSHSPLAISTERGMQRASDGLDRYTLSISLENTFSERLNKVYISEHLGLDVKSIDCTPKCTINGDKITFALDRLEAYSTILLTAQYSVENISFEVNYTIANLDYLAGELLGKSQNFTGTPEYHSYNAIKSALASGETKIILTDGKKLIGELKKMLDKLEKENNPPKNSTIDVETTKQIEKTFTELNNKISKVCQFASCSTLHALYDEAYLNWKQKSAFNADPVTKEFEKKTKEVMKEFEKTDFEGASGLLEKFRKAVILAPSLNLSSPAYSISDYLKFAKEFEGFAKISAVAGLPAGDEAKLFQLADFPKDKTTEYLGGLKSFSDGLNRSLIAMKEDAQDEILRAKGDSKKAGTYFEAVANAEKAYSRGEYNSAIAYARQVPLISVEKGDALPYFLMIPFIGLAGAFIFVLRRPKKRRIQPKSLQEVFYGEKE